jgi:hypothetical protein
METTQGISWYRNLYLIFLLSFVFSSTKLRRTGRLNRFCPEVGKGGGGGNNVYTCM